MAQIKKDTSLRKAILQAAIKGQLISDIGGESDVLFSNEKKSKTKLDSEADLPLASRVSKRNSVVSDSERPTLPETGKELLDRIIEERNKKLLAEWEEALKKNVGGKATLPSFASKTRAKKPVPVVASEIEEEEIPFEVPESWCWCRLGDICTKLVDGDHNPPAGLPTKTEYIMDSSQNINNDSLVDLDKVRYLSKEVFEVENERTKAEKGDIFFTLVGTLGRSCVYDGSKNICF